jgi:translation initiation factor IF-1
MRHVLLHELLARIRGGAAAAAAAAALAAGCAQTPAPLDITTETTQTLGTVEAVDPSTRMVTLKGEDGTRTTVQVGPEVRNLAQVRVGDRVVVRYQEALLAEVIKPGTGIVGAGAAVTRADPGQRPAATVSDTARLPVKIYEVDTVQNIVEVTGPRGFNQRIRVNDPRAREFIRGLKRGDEVEVTVREAFAVSVEPAK